MHQQCVGVWALLLFILISIFTRSFHENISWAKTLQKANDIYCLQWCLLSYVHDSLCVNIINLHATFSIVYNIYIREINKLDTNCFVNVSNIFCNANILFALNIGYSTGTPLLYDLNVFYSGIKETENNWVLLKRHHYPLQRPLLRRTAVSISLKHYDVSLRTRRDR